MKKIYFAPKINIVMLQSHPIMGIGSTSETTVSQSASNFSRDGGSWDDED